MRIAMLGHKRIPSREGGVEVVVEELSTRMAALGHEVTVYSRKGHNVAGAEHDDEGLSALEEHKGVRIVRVPTIDARGLAAASSSYFATRAAVADRPDVIHFHAEGPCAMIGMARRAGIRTVATIHGLDWQRAKWGGLARRYIKHGEKVAAEQADEVIVLSGSMREYFAREYGRETRFVPNGIDPKEPVGLGPAAERLGLEGDGYVLYLGRIVPEKGAHYLIDAFKRVRTGRKLVIAGGPSDSRGYYEELVERASGDDRIVFAGFVQGRELEELYSNASLYVLPSDLEGMPLSLLEAMAHGCCCLTSDIPECTEVLAGCGRTFARGDVDDLARSLSRLLDETDARGALGTRARSRVLESYDWGTATERTLALYEGLEG